jgi:quercetin dioxygenase-like cupin family protein
MQLIESNHNFSSKKHAERLLQREQYDVINIYMQAGEEITEHHAKEETLIIVRAGKVKFDVEGKKIILTDKKMLQMEPYEKHSLKAVEESDLLLLKFR